MKPKQFGTKWAFEALAQGDKVRVVEWPEGDFVHFNENERLVDEEGSDFVIETEGGLEWELYKEPEKEEPKPLGRLMYTVSEDLKAGDQVYLNEEGHMHKWSPTKTAHLLDNTQTCIFCKTYFSVAPDKHQWTLDASAYKSLISRKNSTPCHFLQVQKELMEQD